MFDHQPSVEFAFRRCVCIAFAGLALSVSGCEIALLVAAAADSEPDDSYDDYVDYTYCDEFIDPELGLRAERNQAAIFAPILSGVSTTVKPLKLLATHNVYPFFLSTTARSDLGLRIAASGELSRRDSNQSCTSVASSTAASFLEVESGAAGTGSIVVYVENVEYDRFDFETVDVQSLELGWDPAVNTAFAKLTDKNGREVYGYSGITWEAAPVGLIGPGAGPISPVLVWNGNAQEVLVFAFYQELVAQLTLVPAADGGLTPKPE